MAIHWRAVKNSLRGTISFVWYMYDNVQLIGDKKAIYHGQRFLFFLRWISWRAFLVEVSGHKLESFQTRVFAGFLPFFCSIICYLWKDLSYLVSRIFCVRILKSREGYGFFFKSTSWRDCQQHGAKDSSLLLNWCLGIPSTVFCVAFTVLEAEDCFM